MAARRQGEQRWRASLMAVINDNGPEESWYSGATYIIPSHQSMHLCGLSSANQHTTVRREGEEKHLIYSQSVKPPRSSFYDSSAAWHIIAEQGNDLKNKI